MSFRKDGICSTKGKKVVVHKVRDFLCWSPIRCHNWSTWVTRFVYFWHQIEPCWFYVCTNEVFPGLFIDRVPVLHIKQNLVYLFLCHGEGL